MTIAVVLQTYTHMYMYYGFLRCMGILPHKGYNPYALENHSTTDLYYAARVYFHKGVWDF